MLKRHSNKQRFKIFTRSENASSPNTAREYQIPHEVSNPAQHQPRHLAWIARDSGVDGTTNSLGATQGPDPIQHRGDPPLSGRRLAAHGVPAHRPRHRLHRVGERVQRLELQADQRPDQRVPLPRRVDLVAPQHGRPRRSAIGASVVAACSPSRNYLPSGPVELGSRSAVWFSSRRRVYSATICSLSPASLSVRNLRMVVCSGRALKRWQSRSARP